MRDGNGFRFRNHQQIETLIHNAEQMMTLIDSLDFNLSKVDNHEVETLLCVSAVRSECQRLISIGREIRRANRP